MSISEGLKIVYIQNYQFLKDTIQNIMWCWLSLFLCTEWKIPINTEHKILRTSKHLKVSKYLINMYNFILMF